jgi:hydroxymethylbilane synthase
LLSIEHGQTRTAVRAERAVLGTLEAGCAAPIGAHATIDGDLLSLTAVVYDPSGAAELGCTRRAALTGIDDDTLAEALGAAVAAQLLEDGAAELAPLGGVA